MLTGLGLTGPGQKCVPRVMAPSKKAGISGVGRKTMRMFRSSQLGGGTGWRRGIIQPEKGT